MRCRWHSTDGRPSGGRAFTGLDPKIVLVRLADALHHALVVVLAADMKYAHRVCTRGTRSRCPRARCAGRNPSAAGLKVPGSDSSALIARYRGCRPAGGGKVHFSPSGSPRAATAKVAVLHDRHDLFGLHRDRGLAPRSPSLRVVVVRHEAPVVSFRRDTTGCAGQDAFGHGHDAGPFVLARERKSRTDSRGGTPNPPGIPGGPGPVGDHRISKANLSPSATSASPPR